MTRKASRPVALIIRDGWGANPYPEWNHANAVYLAKKPVDDMLMARYPHVLIKTSGNAVGLPEGVMGNSEVGHQNIGAGRVVEQELMRITGRIRDGTFFGNDVLREAFRYAEARGANVHLLGLCSDGRVHSDLEHLYALLELARRQQFPGHRVFIHAFTDGRDTAPNRGIEFLHAIEVQCQALGVGRIASVVGRYYAMDRDHRWERIERAYRMLVYGEGKRFGDPIQAIADYYQNPDPDKIGDEFVSPRVIVAEGQTPNTIRDEDSVIFFNFRGDRPRQLTKAFVLNPFPYYDVEQSAVVGFQRVEAPKVYFCTLTAYEEDLPVHTAFDKPAKMVNILGAYLAEQGLRQFRCAETEKYAHVTFFLNDYRDDPFEGEERLLIPSPRNVATYDQKPEMSAFEVTDAILARLSTHDDDCLIINYANGDMVGHTGNLPAAIRAVEAVDACVGSVVEAVQKKGGALIVTADHGNCEQMIDPLTGGAHTAHTSYDVECILVDDHCRGRTLARNGRLASIAPTLLDLMNLPIPSEMTGHSLLR